LPAFDPKRFFVEAQSGRPVFAGKTLTLFIQKQSLRMVISDPAIRMRDVRVSLHGMAQIRAVLTHVLMHI